MRGKRIALNINVVGSWVAIVDNVDCAGFGCLVTGCVTNCVGDSVSSNRIGIDVAGNCDT